MKSLKAFRANAGDKLYEKDNVRSIYVREGDAIIYSNAFRRLAYKSQIFTTPQNDHVRTRLTHTLEVVRIAKNISRILELNVDLTEAIALGHDIGHAPFGHAGEEALDEIARKYNISPGKWDHSENSFALVSQIPSRFGKRFSFETLDGIRNHRADYKDFAKKAPASLEGQVVRFADDMAYLTHDIEDAHRSQIIDKTKVFKSMIKKNGFNLSYGRVKISDLDRRAMGVLDPDLHIRIKTIINRFIAFNLKCFKKNSADAKKPLLLMELHCAYLMELTWKEIIENKIHSDPRIKSRYQEAKRIVEQVFEYYLNYTQQRMAGAGDKEFEVHVREHKASIKMPNDADRQVLMNFISGMTDRYILRKYQQFIYPEARA
ncbi:HD domain-containing protein [Candidatus Bathyarchaeota archaeon]|nr:HD domain-containing protein [Candidatus Bathyarchaeota archaeon]